jgi:hypothetical protein
VPEPLILADPAIYMPEDRDFWTTPEMYDPVRRRPAFMVKETANVFFGMSPQWLRKHLRIGSTIVDGEDWQPERSDSNYRLFRLYDIERIAHALAENRVITGQHLELVTIMVKTSAQMHHYIG